MSIHRISGAENKEAYVASCQTHMSLFLLLHHLKYSLTHPKNLWLHLLSSAVKHHLCTMLKTKLPPQISPIQPQGKKNSVESVVILLHLVVHPHQHPRNQGSNHFTKNIFWTRTLMSTSRQRNAHFKAKRGAIPPLRGENISGSGYQRPQIQHRGRNRLSSGKTPCGIYAQI